MPSREAWRVGGALTALSLLVSWAGADAPLADVPPLGRLVDIGGYRLHLRATGEGSPTVVLEAGAGDFSFDWSLVQPAVARFTRVIAYDRAGSAWSDPGPTPRTMKQQAYELHRLLTKAGLRPPYVLVGHSYGGLLARTYARDYPGEVAGMVLVDSTHEDTQLGFFRNGKTAIVRVREEAKGRRVPPVQTMKTSPPRPPSPQEIKEAEGFRKMFPPKIEPPFDRLPPDVQKVRLWALSHPKLSAAGEDYWPEELQEMYTSRRVDRHPLGDIPLIVLAGGKQEGGDPPPGVSADEWKRLGEEKRRQKADQATLSTNSRFIVDPKSGHHIQLDDPALVIDSIHEVVQAVRHHSRLDHPLTGTPVPSRAVE